MFDYVSLKSFIEDEIKGETDITVKAYGIQSDDIDGVENLDTSTIFTETGYGKLKEIFAICQNRAK